MWHIPEELVLARLEDKLEKILQDDADFQQQAKILQKTSIRFREGCGMASAGWKLYDNLEDEYLKYQFMYGERAYRLGLGDGIQVAAEHQVKTKKSVLSLQDMEHLVHLYDAAKKVKCLFLGTGEACHTEEGVLGEFERIFDLIRSAACAEIIMLGADESAERVEYVLNNDGLSFREKAAILSGDRGI